MIAHARISGRVLRSMMSRGQPGHPQRAGDRLVLAVSARSGRSRCDLRPTTSTRSWAAMNSVCTRGGRAAAASTGEVVAPGTERAVRPPRGRDPGARRILWWPGPGTGGTSRRGQARGASLRVAGDRRCWARGRHGQFPRPTRSRPGGGHGDRRRAAGTAVSARLFRARVLTSATVRLHAGRRPGGAGVGAGRVTVLRGRPMPGHALATSSVVTRLGSTLWASARCGVRGPASWLAGREGHDRGPPPRGGTGPPARARQPARRGGLVGNGTPRTQHHRAAQG